MTDYARYFVTERRDAGNPTNDDPKAQAMRLHSGVFDVRDSQSANVICASVGTAAKARSLAARWNTLLIPTI